MFDLAMCVFSLLQLYDKISTRLIRANQSVPADAIPRTREVGVAEVSSSMVLTWYSIFEYSLASFPREAR